jgi:hypothetical protein
VTLGELSSRRAAVYGAVAIGIALVLLVLQVNVAQVEGIDHNIGTIRGRIDRSYTTLGQVVAKSAPTPVMAQQVDQIARDQSAMATTMAQLDATLGTMRGSTDRLAATTAGMVATNRGVQQSLDGMLRDLAGLTVSIDSLVPVSRATGTKLAAMRHDSRATDRALQRIVAKMLSYGLPQVRE